MKILLLLAASAFAGFNLTANKAMNTEQFKREVIANTGTAISIDPQLCSSCPIVAYFNYTGGASPTFQLIQTSTQTLDPNAYQNLINAHVPQ